MKGTDKNKHREAGFSLIELIIAMMIFLIAIAAIYQVARLANIQRSTVVARTDQLRGARIAFEYIRRDAMNAGFGYHRTGGNAPDNIGNSLFKSAADADVERDLLTAILAGNDINNNSLNTSMKTDAVAFISRDSAFNGNKALEYTGTTTSGSRVDVATADGAAAVCNRYDLYLFEPAAGTTQVVGMATAVVDDNSIRLAVNDPLGVNQAANGTGDEKSLLAAANGKGTIKKINLISYSVSEDGVLIRTEYGNQTGKAKTEQIVERELVLGVSNFQIKYFMPDGTVIDDPSAGNDGRAKQIKMNDVVQIQISITLLPDKNSRDARISAPVTLNEYIGTKNLRYEGS